MNVYQLLDVLDQANREDGVSSHATKLYTFLVIRANKRFWKGPMQFTWKQLQEELRMPEYILSNAIAELVARNLITYVPSKDGDLFWFPEPSEQSDRFASISQNSTSRDPGREQYVSECDTYARYRRQQEINARLQEMLPKKYWEYTLDNYRNPPTKAHAF